MSWFAFTFICVVHWLFLYKKIYIQEKRQSFSTILAVQWHNSCININKRWNRRITLSRCHSKVLNTMFRNQTSSRFSTKFARRHFVILFLNTKQLNFAASLLKNFVGICESALFVGSLFPHGVLFDVGHVGIVFFVL